MHCVDCEKSLGQSCQTSHDTFTAGHHIITIEDFASGQISTEGRVCQVHGEKVRYYCETEEKQVCLDCISLNTCSSEHKRLALKDAAKKHAALIEELRKECANNKKKFQSAVQESNSVLNDLTDLVKKQKV